MRKTLPLTAAAVLAAGLATATPAAADSIRGVVAEDPGAAAAVRAVSATGVPAASQLAALPADFAAKEGYTPVARRFVLRADGGCSAPFGTIALIPAALDDPCRAHDLGYDLLRYADARGHPLGAWARRAVDDAFARRARAACASMPDGEHATCRRAAAVAVAAVRVNSWRQRDAAPRPESAAGLVASWLTGGGRW
ncbi:hypothetical protein P0W64_04790 [Tsukamurella sp. 8F]|uniref:hypothetical protein n=1 Tax=Tsukamurella sp. 8F TaxID=3031961 RepID=UPI0023B9F193|nr:hypothetical protein [Tsukamurella sp. 8F]MDF0586092.1 hypothetical protein [Tsukamurella sp. 8F]